MSASSQHWRALLLPGWPCRGWSGPAWPGSSPRCPPTRARGSRACRGWGRLPRPATQSRDQLSINHSWPWVTWPALHQSQLTCSTTPWPELWTSTRPVTLTPSSTAPGTRSTTAAAHVSRVTCQQRPSWGDVGHLLFSCARCRICRGRGRGRSRRRRRPGPAAAAAWVGGGDRWQVTGAGHLTSCLQVQVQVQGLVQVKVLAGVVLCPNSP